MDRYLFRGKRVDTWEWVQGNLYFNVDGVAIIVNKENCTKGFRPIIDQGTLGQSTGLKDKNGKLIFEGDICKDSSGWIFTVVWDNENAKFIGKHDKPRGDTYICYIGREPTPVEIIGNIHDKEG